jgi:hypothetical protein
VERSLRQMSSAVHVSMDATLDMLGERLTPAVIEPVLRQFGLRTVRQRKLPMIVVMLVCIAINLFADQAIEDVLAKLWQGPRFLRPDDQRLPASKGAISQRRQQLGVRPLVALFHQVCRPLASPTTPGAFLAGLRLMALDGTVEDVADTPANAAYFGYWRGQRGRSAFPQVEALYLCECATHAICDVGFWPRQGQERAQARRLLRSVQPGMLVLWDAGLYSYDLCAGCVQRGAHFLARITAQFKLAPLQRLADGSYLAELQPRERRRRRRGEHTLVRVIEYRLDDPGRPGHGQTRRLITSYLDEVCLPAQVLACAYHERWEIELTIDEIDTHQRPPRQPLRSRTPLGVLQELYGLVIAHYAVRAVMHQAAEQVGVAPNDLSFTKTLRLVRNALFEAQIVSRAQWPAWWARLLADIGRARLPQRDNRCNPRVVRRKLAKFPLKRDRHRQPDQPTKSFAQAVVILGVPPTQPCPLPSEWAPQPMPALI